VPVTETVSCAPEASVTASVPVKVPYATGANVTVMAHVAPDATTDPQLFRWVRDGSPLMAIPAIPTEAPLLLVTVTFWLGLSPMV